jgi:hypothetical protein
MRLWMLNEAIDLHNRGLSFERMEELGLEYRYMARHLQNKLRNIRDAYFNTESLNKKKKLRNDYDQLVSVGPSIFGDESEKTKQLKTYRPFDNESSSGFFNPEFMFGIKDFSIVFGNPPYISYYSKQSIKLDKKIEINLRNNYRFLVNSCFR